MPQRISLASVSTATALKPPTKRPLTLGEWINQKALNMGLASGTVWRYYYEGKFPQLKVKRVNARTILVEEE